MPQTFAGVGPNGQDISITSGETVGATMTTDTFTVSTPTSFLTTPTFSGVTITQLQFDLGNANSGSNPVNLLQPISGTYTASGSVVYGGGSTLPLSPATTLGPGNLSYSANEGVNGGSAISGFAVSSFTYSINYANPAPTPKPSAWAIFGLGGLCLGGLGLRARRRAAVSV